MSQFDPTTFLDATTSEVNERRDPIPAQNADSPDGLYTAIIGEVTTQDGTIGKGERVGQPWVSMVIPLKLQLGPQTQAKTGLPPEFQLTDRVFLDLTPQGAIDNAKGKNRGQKAYRDATGLNKPGEPFSWRMVQGKVVKIRVDHELYEGAIVERVGAILPAQ